MTITLAWWWIPVLLVVAAFVAPMFFPDRGWYDFSPIIGLGLFLIFIVAAIAVCVGVLIGQP